MASPRFPFLLFISPAKMIMCYGSASRKKKETIDARSGKTDEGMKSKMLIFVLLAVVLVYCRSKPSFTEQVRHDFSNRVLRVDSSIRVDSFQLVRMDSITEQIGQIIYDSIYAREEARLEAAFIVAKRNPAADTSYLLEEINYMKKELDSIGNLITKADTVKKYGVLARYSYTISKNEKSQTGGVYYFISNNGIVLNPDMINDSVKVITAQLK